MKIENKLPTNWSITIQDSTLIIQRNDSIWEMHGNWINAERSHMMKRNDSTWIKTHGQKIKARFTYSLKKKMKPNDFENYKRSMSSSRFGRRPDEVYQSEFFMITLTSSRGMKDEFTAIHPKSVSEEMYSISDLIRKILN